jgi:hypothetical protein
MASMLERIRNSENVAQEITDPPLETKPDANEE